MWASYVPQSYYSSGIHNVVQSIVRSEAAVIPRSHEGISSILPAEIGSFVRAIFDFPSLFPSNISGGFIINNLGCSLVPFLLGSFLFLSSQGQLLLILLYGADFLRGREGRNNSSGQAGTRYICGSWLRRPILLVFTECTVVCEIRFVLPQYRMVLVLEQHTIYTVLYFTIPGMLGLDTPSRTQWNPIKSVWIPPHCTRYSLSSASSLKTRIPPDPPHLRPPLLSPHHTIPYHTLPLVLLSASTGGYRGELQDPQPPPSERSG